MSAVFGVVVLRDTHSVLDLYSKLFVVVLNITNPVAGVLIASRSVVVIRGGKNPFVVEVTSNCAEGCMLAVETPIPTWALVVVVMANAMISADARNIFFIFLLFVFLFNHEFTNEWMDFVLLGFIFFSTVMRSPLPLVGGEVFYRLLIFDATNRVSSCRFSGLNP